MKARLFIVFALGVGLLLLLAWVVAAQGMPDKLTGAIHASRQPMALNATPEFTFTPAFTVDLPIILGGPGQAAAPCSVAPTLLSPADGSALDTLIPRLRWYVGTHEKVTQARMQLALDVGFTQVQVTFVFGGASGEVGALMSRNLEPATTYYWRAWSVCEDVLSPYSDVRSLTTSSGGVLLPAPILVAPANGTTVPSTTVTLEWSAVNGAVEYLVSWQVGISGRRYTWTSGTQHQLTGLDPSTPYNWWVTPANDFAFGEASATWQFLTPAISTAGAPAPPGQTPAWEEDDVIFTRK